jgi:hypothetical protein
MMKNSIYPHGNYLLYFDSRYDLIIEYNLKFSFFFGMLCYLDFVNWHEKECEIRNQKANRQYFRNINIICFYYVY